MRNLGIALVALIFVKPAFAIDPRVVLQQRCAQCHAGASPIGGTLPLDDREALRRYYSTIYCRSVVQILAERIMPPADAPPLDAAERCALIDYLK